MYTSIHTMRRQKLTGKTKKYKNSFTTNRIFINNLFDFIELNIPDIQGVVSNTKSINCVLLYCA